MKFWGLAIWEFFPVINVSVNPAGELLLMAMNPMPALKNTHEHIEYFFVLMTNALQLNIESINTRMFRNDTHNPFP